MNKIKRNSDEIQMKFILDVRLEEFRLNLDENKVKFGQNLHKIQTQIQNKIQQIQRKFKEQGITLEEFRQDLDEI